VKGKNTFNVGALQAKARKIQRAKIEPSTDADKPKHNVKSAQMSNPGSAGQDWNNKASNQIAKVTAPKKGVARKGCAAHRS